MRSEFEINENAFKEAIGVLYNLMKYSRIRHERAKRFATDLRLIADRIEILNPEGLTIVREEK